MSAKRCCTCKLEKDVSLFGKSTGQKDGLRKRCKECNNKGNAEYRARHPEASAAASANWAKRNPEKVKEKQRRFVDRKGANYSAEVMAKWRSENPDRHKENDLRYRSLPHVRVHRTIRERLRNILRGKSKGTFDHFDFTRDQLIRHLEQQFTNGMSWDNFGDWHIDHITPLSSFDISSEDDPNLKSAWCLSNLRPLWAEENLRKHAKIVFLL